MTRFRPIWLLVLFCGLGVAAKSALPSGDDSSPPTAEERTQGYRNGRVLVKLREGVAVDADSNRQDIESRHGVMQRRVFRYLDRQQVLELDGSRDVPATIKELQASGLYEFVEPDRIIRAMAVPNDASFPIQWSLNNTGQSGGVIGADIRAVSAWDTLNDASTVVVGVLDSGIRATHTDLAANLWNNPSPNTSGYPNDLHGINATVAQGGSTSGNPNDDSSSGHGTHVSGIIGAVGNNGLGTSGVAWKVQLMALKFLDSTGSGSLSAELAGINYAIAHGASIINGSFGATAFSSSEYTAMQQLRSAGIIMVVAAGNDGLSVESDSTYPAGYLLDNIVTVAATTRTDALASYSNFSSGLVDLGAPGDEITSTLNTSDLAYGVLSGTSMAAPHVTGALALLKKKFPADTYRELINRLLRSTTKTAALTGMVQTGGRLNLANALASTDHRPFNDDFATRAQLSGSNIRIRASNVDATGEAGEPAQAGVTTSHSLWWTWTAPTTTLVSFDTVGSSFDTTLAVYTGSAVNALTLVGANDDASPGVATSRVTISATAGTTYQIAVDGKSGATGLALLKLGAVPPNDNFANAQTVSGSSFSVTGTTINASAESGEPKHAGVGAGVSVWYKWAAPTTGRYQLAAFSLQADTVAAVYTGSAVSSLTLVASNNDASSLNTDSLVTFNATAGTTYFFAIDAVSTDGGDFVASINDSLWQFSTGDEVTSSPAVGPDGTVYFGSKDGFVYAVNPDGSLKWERATGDAIDVASPALGSDGTVYIGSDDNFLYALNGTTGVRKWRFLATTTLSSAPAIGSDGTVYFRDDTTLYALTSGAAAATKKWSFALSGGTYCSPAVAVDGTIYVGATGGAFYAVNPDGTQKWQFTADDDIYTSPAIGSDGTIYFGTLSGSLYALTPAGTLKWVSRTTGGNSITSSPALGADGTLYFGAYDHKLHAVSSSGTERWSYTMGDEVRASSPAIGADGTIYLGDYDMQLYAISSAGAFERVYSTGQFIRSSPVIANNRLYFGSSDAKLYAIGINQGSAASPWPESHENSAHLGRAASITDVVIATAPQSQVVAPGSTLTLSVAATGTGALSYQWFKDGNAIAGATGSIYTLSGVTLAAAGSYTVSVTNAGGTVTSSPASVIVGTVIPSRLSNLSARAVAGPNAQTLIVGFVVSGASKSVLIRGIGPGLSALGVASPLADPLLSIYDGSTAIQTNDNWGGTSVLSSAFTRLGAFALATGSNDSAILTTLAPKSYTAQITGAGGGPALAEIYDADTSPSPAGRLTNLSARAQVGTDSGVLIAGFVISGTAPKTVLVRAIGPGLTASFGLTGVLADPQIDLYQGSALVQHNDNWGGTTALSAAFAQVAAFAIADPNSKDAAMLVTLQPGAYTALVSGVNSTTGIALVEVYEMP